MVDLPSIPDNVPELRAPTSRVSGGQVAAPWMEFAQTLDKTAGVLSKDIAVPLAERAGLQAVTRDADGNVQVQQAPVVGDAAIAYHRAVKTAALLQAEGELKRGDIALRQQFHDNPGAIDPATGQPNGGYLKAAEEYKKKHVAAWTDAAGPDVGQALGRIIDGQTTTTYRGLLNEKERLDLHRTDQAMQAGIASARDDAVAMARGGVTSGQAWDAAIGKIKALTELRVNNPRLAYPREQADYDMQHMEGDLKANGFLHHIDEVYNDPDPAKGGAQAAMQAAKSILTDPSIKLTEAERNAYYHKAIGEVRANNAERTQDLRENHAAANDLRTASSLGLKIDPERIDQVARQFYKLNDPGSAARLYAWAARAPLNDDFGRQPLAEQTRQLAGIRAPASIRNNNPGAQNVGPVSEHFGAVGSETITGNNQIATFPTPVHGAAAMFALADRSYAGMRLSDAVWRWSGKSSDAPGYTATVSRETGIAPDAVITPEMLRGPQGIQLAKAMSRVEAGRDFPMSDAQWQQAQSAAFGNVALAPGQKAPLDASPTSSLWLSANRQRAVMGEARRDWSTTIKEWNDKGTAPNPEAVRTIVEAARAAGDSDLLDQVGHDMERVQLVQQAAQGPLAGQAAQIAELRRRAAAGEMAPGQQPIMNQLQAKHDAIVAGLKDNPIATTTANFSDRLRTPPPLNVEDSQQLRGGLAMRGRIAQFAAENWGAPTVAAVDKADVAQLQATLERADPATKARIFGDITAALPDDKVRNATFAKLGEGGPKAMVQAFAGALHAQDPVVAASIIRGQDAMKVDERNNPLREGAGARDTFNDAIDKMLPEATFSLAGRTDPSGPYATMRSATIARYADLTAQDPTAKKDHLDNARMQQAVTDVTGGILDHNGGKLIAPARGMPQAIFDRVLGGITDRDLAGVTTLAGEPVTANYLRHVAKLQSLDDGRYLVQLGGDPMRPIYAYRNTGTELPDKFILDLRSRKPAAPEPVNPFGQMALP
jgi:hypothetical protein